MNFITFAKEKPILYGQIRINGKYKIGQFKGEHQSLSNSVMYQYYTHAGNKGTGGFSLMKAYNLLNTGNLSTNPEHGNPENYL